MKNAFCHIQIATRDIKSAKEFYEGIFDWKINVDPATNYGSVDTGEKPGGGLSLVPAEVPIGVTAYVIVSDIAKTLKSITERGGKVLRPKQEILGMGWWALFADPEGNVLGLFTPKT